MVQLPVDDAALGAVLPPGEGIGVRTLLQERLEHGRGRVVERLTLRSGRTVILKARNDRPEDREALLYQRLLPSVGDLAPNFLASATVDGVHFLVLEDVAGRPCDGTDPADRDRAMAALARSHRWFRGSERLDVLGGASNGRMRAELLPDPITPEGLLAVYDAAVARLAPGVSAATWYRLRRLAAPVVAAIAASPLVLDPGDVRPENALIAGERAVLLDFENAGVRRLGPALAAMLSCWPARAAVLRCYLAHAPELAPSTVCRAIAAGRLWLALRQREEALPS